MPKSILKRWERSLRHGLAYYLLQLFRFLIGKLNPETRRKLAGGLAKLAYALPGPKQTVMSHLKEAFGSNSPISLERITQRNFLHMAESITELMWWMAKPPKELGRFIDIVNAEEIYRALVLGKGVIGLTSHLGNWELLGGYISNFVVPISVIAEPVFDSRVNQILVDARTHLGVRTIYRKESGREMLRTLHSGGFLGMLADQDIPSSESIFVSFFSKSALTPIGPATISLHTGAPIVPMFIERLSNGKHLITVDKAIAFNRSGDIKKDIADLTQLWSDVVESHITARPEQWMWLHNRFATRPDGANT